MGGITTGVGLFSGINTAELIEQLIASQSRPKVLAQNRLVQLQSQQAAFMDINGRINAFKTAAAAFRVNKTFDAKLATVSDESVLAASANGTAINGNYNFIVDRLVTTQQMLSRGFADRTDSAIGLPSISFESPQARLDRDTDLNTLNNGAGITRGRIVVNGTEVDLSRVATVGELLDAINGAETGATAGVSGGAIVLDGVTSLADKNSSGVLASIGLSAPSVDGQRYTGATVYGLGSNTALTALNDGRGVTVREATGSVHDFTITIGGAPAVAVRIGQIERATEDEGFEVVAGAASTVGQVVERINTALADAGHTGVTASIDTASGSIVFANSTGEDIVIANAIVAGNEATTTANDLGIAGVHAAGGFSGSRILAGMNTTLVSSLNGGRGLAGTDGVVSFTAGDGSSFSVDVSGATTVAEMVDLINNHADNAGRVVVSLSDVGSGLKAVDATGGPGDLVIAGTAGADAAAALGLAGTHAGGSASGSNLQLAYIGAATRLSTLHNGAGIGTGKFEIVDSRGNIAVIDVGANDKTIGDVIRAINGAGLDVRARINDNGDGITIEETGEPGALKIRITDKDGSVAKKLGVAGEASGTGENNHLRGSFEHTIEFEPTATLTDIVREINAAGAGVRATIINDGSSANPFRISLVSEHSGASGRFLVDTGGFDLGLNRIERGDDARVFYGASDPAKGVLVTSSTNSIDTLIDGVSISLKAVSQNPVSLTVATNTEEIETKITAFVDAFNSIIGRIDHQTRYNDETKERGPLLGDGTVLTLRNKLYAGLRGTNNGFSEAFNRLDQVGLVVGAGGDLTFDSEKFRAAYAQDPEAVEALFTRRDVTEVTNEPDENGVTIVNPDAPVAFDALGVIGQLEQLADSYVSSINGIMQNRNSALDRQISMQQSRIESIQKNLDNKREILQRQFLAMEQAIASFQSQGGALSQISLIG